MQPLAAQGERRRLQSEELRSIIEEIHFYPIRVVLYGTPGCRDVYSSGIPLNSTDGEGRFTLNMFDEAMAANKTFDFADPVDVKRFSSNVELTQEKIGTYTDVYLHMARIMQSTVSTYTWDCKGKKFGWFYSKSGANYTVPEVYVDSRDDVNIYQGDANYTEAPAELSYFNTRVDDYHARLSPAFEITQANFDAPDNESDSTSLYLSIAYDFENLFSYSCEPDGTTTQKGNRNSAGYLISALSPGFMAMVRTSNQLVYKARYKIDLPGWTKPSSDIYCDCYFIDSEFMSSVGVPSATEVISLPREGAEVSSTRADNRWSRRWNMKGTDPTVVVLLRDASAEGTSYTPYIEFYPLRQLGETGLLHMNWAPEGEEDWYSNTTWFQTSYSLQSLTTLD